MRLEIRTLLNFISLFIIVFFDICQGSKPKECKIPNGSPVQEKWVLYKGGVVEYAPFVRWGEGGGKRILQENTDAFVSFAHLAKNQEVDILVYPEYGLTGLDLRKKKSELISFSQHVPEPRKGSVPCLQDDNHHTHQALMNLSCTARSLKMYLVINLIEWQPSNAKNNTKELFFNTQIVLDKKGEVIARYRKKNVLFEDLLTAGTEEPSSALFTTDFGVTFTLQLGFDIMKEEPGVHNLIGGGVMDVAMGSAWIDELPFHTAPQVFSGWARGLGINLLVANYHDPEKAGMGSGIFSGMDPFPMSYSHNLDSHSRTITKEVLTKFTEDPKYQKRKDIPIPGLIVGKVHHSNPPVMIDSDFVDTMEYRTGKASVNYSKIHQDLVNYTSIDLNAQSLKVRLSRTLCDGAFCCRAIYSYREYLADSSGYHLVVYSGLDYKGKRQIQIYVQKCAVVYCLEDNLSSCAKLEGQTLTENGFRLHKLMGMFDTEFIYPSMMNMEFQLVNSEDWDYIRHFEGQWNATIVTKSRIKNLLSASIFARLYEKDTES